MGSVEVSPQMAFARFVRRTIDDARDERGWTVTELAAHTGVGRSTVFRWLAGDWHDYPELAKVRSFCAALDLPVAAAFRALGLPDAGAGSERRGGDGTVEADVRVILQRLADPSVPAEEKHHIRDLLRYLARRPIRRPADPAAAPMRRTAG
ncbi:helix-turn-helix transcriptional regulator [Micromonospora sp. HNM0581]|uniref:helix-turn-helix domain-containing protein n=1 Tax=Micromonospora sp. HNM0581 TaxID=2716341 RepID=UPI00146CA7D2|nr:helix-turn-helix domain-containing protein [Micromonospora sp. HNM0581]NLU77139.1 helix-turn-helix transcriptional regulator [Micromonospora sp. HNM0581]